MPTWALPTHAQTYSFTQIHHTLKCSAMHSHPHLPPPHTHTLAPIHIYERLCHHFSSLTTLAMCCVLGHHPAPWARRFFWSQIPLELKQGPDGFQSPLNSVGITELSKMRMARLLGNNPVWWFWHLFFSSAILSSKKISPNDPHMEGRYRQCCGWVSRALFIGPLPRWPWDPAKEPLDSRKSPSFSIWRKWDSGK